MQNALDMRAITAGKYIIENGATVREAGKALGFSKSTIHNDVHNRLRHIDIDLYAEVKSVLDYHMSVRHIRGGESTRMHYIAISKS